VRRVNGAPLSAFWSQRGAVVLEIGRWVPAAADVDGVEDSLVPGTPTSALICAYPGLNSNPGRESLTGSRVLTDHAKSMAYDLGYLSPPIASKRSAPWWAGR
jgi:hypothetical protein